MVTIYEERGFIFTHSQIKTWVHILTYLVQFIRASYPYTLFKRATFLYLPLFFHNKFLVYTFAAMAYSMALTQLNIVHCRIAFIFYLLYVASAFGYLILYIILASYLILIIKFPSSFYILSLAQAHRCCSFPVALSLWKIKPKSKLIT